MAETVLSMARSMLGGAISMAASAAAAEMGLLRGVRNDIWFIKEELETMQAFLEVAEAMKNKDVLLKVWAKQVRDLSYNIEDSLGEFMVHVGSQSLSQRLMKLKDRHRIAKQIRNLKSRVQEVSLRNTRYNLIKTEASNTTDEVDSYVEDVRNLSASNIDEAELVGFLKSKGELIELMDVNSEDGITKVICVVGMGGLGKTTLARKTYESKEDVVKNFSYRAWITVSQTFSKIEMLKSMIMQFLGDGALKQCLRELEGKMVQVDDLAGYLRKKLEEKRDTIVAERPSKKTCHASGSTSSHPSGPCAWADLLDSLLHQIIALVSSFHDFLAFSGTCRPWRSAVSSFPSVYTFAFPPLHLRTDISHGIFSSNPKWQLVDPAKRTVSLRCSAPRITPHRMRYLGCSYGYLIFSDREHCLLVNVYTGTKVKLPKLRSDSNSLIYYGILMAPVNSPNSHLLLCSRTSMLQWQVGTNSWTGTLVSVNISFRLCSSKVRCLPWTLFRGSTPYTWHLSSACRK